MPTVPYNPVPSVSPSTAGTPSVNISATPDMFGGAVGRALTHFGQQLERSSDEIFTRAVALQEMQNDTVARQAIVDLSIQDSQDTAQFAATKGNNAPDQLEAHQAKLLANRQALRDKLPNDAARRKFDAASQGTFIHSIQGAALHAAGESKKAATNSALAEIQAIKNDLNRTPYLAGEDAYERAVANVGAKVRGNVAGLEGWDSITTEVNVQKHVSDLTLGRIEQITRVAPAYGKALLEKYRSEGRLDHDDAIKAEAIVTGQVRATGAEVIASKVDKSLPEEEQVKQAREGARKLDPNDPMLERNAEHVVRSQNAVIRGAQKRQQAEDWEAISEMIPRVKSEAELLALPGAADIHKRLPPTRQNSLPGIIHRYHAAADKERNDMNLIRLQGMRDSDDPEANIAFRNLDPTKEDLSQSQIRQVMAWQKKAREMEGKTPAVGKYMTMLRNSERGAEMQAHGIYRRNPNDPDNYDRFTGSLSVAIDEWTQREGRPPTPKQIRDEIFPVLAKEKVGNIFRKVFGVPEEPAKFKEFGKATIPEDIRIRLRQKVFDETGEEPDEKDLQRGYFQMMLMEEAEKRAQQRQAPRTRMGPQ